MLHLCNFSHLLYSSAANMYRLLNFAGLVTFYLKNQLLQICTFHDTYTPQASGADNTVWSNVEAIEKMAVIMNHVTLLNVFKITKSINDRNTNLHKTAF